jgi:hypothetical protein
MDKLEDIFIKTLMVLAIVLSVFVMILIIALPCTMISDKKEYDRANTVMRYQQKTYYIITYEYKDDYIKAIDVNGHDVILPKDNTVIEEK